MPFGKFIDNAASFFVAAVLSVNSVKMWLRLQGGLDHFSDSVVLFFGSVSENCGKLVFGDIFCGRRLFRCKKPGHRSTTRASCGTLRVAARPTSTR